MTHDTIGRGQARRDALLRAEEAGMPFLWHGHTFLTDTDETRPAGTNSSRGNVASFWSLLSVVSEEIFNPVRSESSDMPEAELLGISMKETRVYSGVFTLLKWWLIRIILLAFLKSDLT